MLTTEKTIALVTSASSGLGIDTVIIQTTVLARKGFARAANCPRTRIG